jgi:adenylate cyclase, class 2
MSTRKANLEIEIKLRVRDVPALRRRLKQLRARVITPCTYESNTLYDTPKKDLARRGQLIRIRTEQPSSTTARKNSTLAPKALLTYKGPPPKSGMTIRQANDERRSKSRYKVREEIEIVVSDGEPMRRILGALGLCPLFRYEKFRTTYAISMGASSRSSPLEKNVRHLKIEVDVTPIGTFLELEGTPSSIDRVARLLGYSQSDYITQTYGALYIAHSRLHGYKPTNMLFPPTKNCIDTHSFLDKDFNSVYLLSVSFLAGAVCSSSPQEIGHERIKRARALSE